MVMACFSLVCEDLSWCCISLLLLMLVLVVVAADGDCCSGSLGEGGGSLVNFWLLLCADLFGCLQTCAIVV